MLVYDLKGAQGSRPVPETTDQGKKGEEQGKAGEKSEKDEEVKRGRKDK